MPSGYCGAEADRFCLSCNHSSSSELTVEVRTVCLPVVGRGDPRLCKSSARALQGSPAGTARPVLLDMCLRSVITLLCKMTTQLIIVNCMFYTRAKLFSDMRSCLMPVSTHLMLCVASQQSTRTRARHRPRSQENIGVQYRFPRTNSSCF